MISWSSHDWLCAFTTKRDQCDVDIVRSLGVIVFHAMAKAKRINAAAQGESHPSHGHDESVRSATAAGGGELMEMGGWCARTGGRASSNGHPGARRVRKLPPDRGFLGVIGTATWGFLGVIGIPSCILSTIVRCDARPGHTFSITVFDWSDGAMDTHVMVCAVVAGRLNDAMKGSQGSEMGFVHV
jgi:hypothetical protein